MLASARRLVRLFSPVAPIWMLCCVYVNRAAPLLLFFSAALQIARAFNQLFDLKLTTRGEMEVWTLWGQGRGVWGV